MKSKEKIEDVPTETIEIEKLVFDPFNTNTMTDKQMDGLHDSMTVWGMRKPIVIDQDNIVIDGEHRVRTLKKLGIKTVEAKRRHVTETQRRLLRQVMNKLHGQPDQRKDAMDLQYLEGDETAAVMLEEMLDIKESDVDEMTKFMNEDNINVDEPLDRTRDAKRRIVLFFTPQEFPIYRKKLDQLMEALHVTTEVEVIKELVNEAVT